MPSTNPTTTAASAILDLLSGPLDECSRDLARGDVPTAQTKLRKAVERLQRIRRDMM